MGPETGGTQNVNRPVRLLWVSVGLAVVGLVLAVGCKKSSPAETAPAPEVQVTIMVTFPSPTYTPTPKWVFVTSTLQTPQGNLAAMDSVCQVRAAAGGLGGTWKAWASASGGPANFAVSRFNNVGPWHLLNGKKVADGIPDLTDGDIWNPINIDEFGNPITPGTEVWTGTNTAGQPAGTNTCLDWTSISPGDVGQYGLTWWVVSSPQLWTDISNSPCDSLKALYCFEQ